MLKWYNIMLLRFQNFRCRSVSVGFERKNCGFIFLDKCIRLLVFIVTRCHNDVAAASQVILSALEHFSQIHTNHLGAQTTSPSVAVGSLGGHPAGGVGQDTGGHVTIHVLYYMIG